MQRRATLAVALTLGAMSAPGALAAQSRGGPGPETPRILVAVFASSDRASGVQAADAIRNRVQSANNVRQLYVIPKTDITNYLESSGYKPDSSLGRTDLEQLARLLRADEVLAGRVTPTAGGVNVEPRLMLARDVSIAQPLPPIEVAKAADAARHVERTLGEARKQLPDNRTCENAVRDQDFNKAIAAAKAGIAKYPDATIARLCLAMAYQTMKAPPDSVLRVTDEIRRLDPRNTLALRLAFTAYQEQGDQENAVRALVGLFALEPSNQTLQTQVVTELAKLGKPSVALPIVDTLLAQNPGDPTLLRQKWLLSLAAAAADTTLERPVLLEQAVKAGEEMIRIDTTLADSLYYARQIVAGNAMVPPRGVEFASRAVQKFPNITEFWWLKANAEKKAGQLQMALESTKRALAIDPKFPSLNLLLAQIHLELNQADSVVAVSRRAVAAGEDPKMWGAFLLSPTQAAWNLADRTKAAADYEKVLELGQESDKLAPSATAKFFIGVSSFFIAGDLLQQAQKAKSCPLARRAQDMLLLTQTNMPAGGSVEPNTAKTVLGYVSQYATPAEQMVKQYCK